MNETEEYLGLLTGQHVSIVVAISHTAATYLINAFLSANLFRFIRQKTPKVSVKAVLVNLDDFLSNFGVSITPF